MGQHTKVFRCLTIVPCPVLVWFTVMGCDCVTSKACIDLTGWQARGNS